MVEDNRKNINCESNKKDSDLGKMYQPSSLSEKTRTDWPSAFYQQQELFKQVKGKNIPSKEHPESIIENITLEEKTLHTKDTSR